MLLDSSIYNINSTRLFIYPKLANISTHTERPLRMDEEKKQVGGSNQPSSSNSSQRLHLNDSDMSLDGGGGGGGDDLGWWDCSLCTYRNSADKFKCEVCDLRRGTSTRKPRCNADTIVAQVVKQQEQIRQQTKVQKTPKRPSRPSRPSQSSQPAQPAQTSQPSRPSQPSPAPSSTSEDYDMNDDADHATDISGTHSDSSDTENQISDDSSSSSSTTASSLPAAEPTSTKPFDNNNPFKITPLEVDGNLIKYSPPTSNGRTGLIIDKKRFTQHSVTVNDVTITFTEFATRQNRYVRKKKRVRDRSKPIGNGNKNRVQPKSEP